nr:inositol 2-dehydrogenase-like [Cherax quadricarinatus]
MYNVHSVLQANMSTSEFASASPYSQGKQIPHITDFKHKEYLLNAGLHTLSNKYAVNVPEDLKVVNVALFALGRAGSFHLTNIMKSSRICLKYLVESDTDKLLRAKAEWRLPESVLLFPDEADRVFQDPSVHGVIIATPTFMHKDLIIRGLSAGKAVFCEKPIAEDIKGTRQCYEVAEKVGKPLMCGFNRRFDPSFSHLRDQVLLGVVGQVQLVKTVARDSPLPSIEYLKISGGIFHDCAVHDVDLICWVTGEYPTHVFASATAFIPEVAAINDHDTVAFTMKFPSGTISMTDLSRYAAYGYDQRLEVFGPKGMVASGNERPYQMTTSTVQGESQPPILHSFPSRYYDGYINELNHFCDVIQGLVDLQLSGENTLKVSTIATALEESAATGQMIEIKY